MDEIGDEVTDHRDKLAALSARQDKAAETADKLQTDVSQLQSEIRDVVELRSKLEETTAEVKEQHGKLDELSAQHDKTAESVEQLRTDVNDIQSKVFDFCS